MAMTPGEVGVESDPPGLANSIYEELMNHFEAAYTDPQFDRNQPDTIKAFTAASNALAKAVVEYIQAQAQVNNVTAGTDTVPNPNAIT
jgi:hypothetical protein